jgi:hypothetical protein
MRIILHHVHAAHAAHAARHAAAEPILLRKFGNHGFRGDQQRSNRSCVLQSRTNNLDRVDDAHGDHVAIFGRLGVVAVVVLILVENLADNDRSFVTSVLGDLANQRLQGAANDVDASFLVVVHTLCGDLRRGAEQSDTAAWDDTFLNGSARRVERVVDAVLLFLDFDFRRAANADDGNAASELGKAFLQLFAVIIGRGFFDLSLDLCNAAFDVGLGASAVDDRGVFLGDRNLLRTAEHVRALRIRA